MPFLNLEIETQLLIFFGVFFIISILAPYANINKEEKRLYVQLFFFTLTGILSILTFKLLNNFFEIRDLRFYFIIFSLIILMLIYFFIIFFKKIIKVRS